MDQTTLTIYAFTLPVIVTYVVWSSREIWVEKKNGQVWKERYHDMQSIAANYKLRLEKTNESLDELKEFFRNLTKD